MKWKSVSEPPSVYGDGQSEELMIWLTDGTHTEGYYSGGQWWLGKSGEPTHWSLITPPSDESDEVGREPEMVRTQIKGRITGGYTEPVYPIESDGPIESSDGLERQCPCLLADQPCKPDCSCVHWPSSAGCRCCASYGSDEQRKHAANLIVARSARPDPSAALAEALESLEHTRYWYGCRLERLSQFMREEATPEIRHRYFSIIANGAADHAEPPTYAQQMNTLKHKVAGLAKVLEILYVECCRNGWKMDCGDVVNEALALHRKAGE